MGKRGKCSNVFGSITSNSKYCIVCWSYNAVCRILNFMDYQMEGKNLDVFYFTIYIYDYCRICLRRQKMSKTYAFSHNLQKNAEEDKTTVQKKTDYYETHLSGTPQSWKKFGSHFWRYFSILLAFLRAKDGENIELWFLFFEFSKNLDKRQKPVRFDKNDMSIGHFVEIFDNL